MKKYFIVNIQFTADSNPYATSDYSTIEEAKSAFHSILASNYASPVLKGFAVSLMDECGITVMNEYKSVSAEENLK